MKSRLDAFDSAAAKGIRANEKGKGTSQKKRRMTPDEIAKAFARLRLWDEKGVTLRFGFIGPTYPFSIEVKVKGVSSESVSFQWLLFAVDDNKPFISTNGFFVVWLKDATLSIGDDSEPSVTISRDPFRLDLTVIRASA